MLLTKSLLRRDNLGLKRRVLVNFVAFLVVVPAFSRLHGVSRPASFLVARQVRSMAGVLSSWSLLPRSTTIFESGPILGVTTTLSIPRLAAGGILNLQGRMREEIGVLGFSISSSLSSMMMALLDEVPYDFFSTAPEAAAISLPIHCSVSASR